MHHLAGHIESIFLEHGNIPLPAAVLVVSGGHTSLYFVPEPGVYALVGRTRDDAAGEAYDKVAKLLGLGLSGRAGRSTNWRARATIRPSTLPRPRFTHADRNPPPPDLASRVSAGPQALAEFSFSGLKTAVVRYLRERGVAVGDRPRGAVRRRAAVADRKSPTSARAFSASSSRRWWTARSPRRAWLGARSIGIAGGVSANSRLRRDAIARGEREGVPVFVPSIELSTDNAAMIAAAALRKLERGERRRWISTRKRRWRLT